MNQAAVMIDLQCATCGESVVFEPLTDAERAFNADGGLIRPWRHIDAGTRHCKPACSV
jgi:hypothetical protein